MVDVAWGAATAAAVASETEKGMFMGDNDVLDMSGTVI